MDLVPWASLGLTLDSLWLPFGCPWAPFGSLWVPFGSLWCPLAPFGSLLGALWLHLGTLWLPFGCPLAHLAVHWGPFGPLWCVLGRPWDPFGPPWAPLGRLLDFLKIGSHFPSKCAKFIVNCSKIEPPGIHHRIQRIQRKWWQQLQLGPPFHTRRGP